MKNILLTEIAGFVGCYLLTYIPKLDNELGWKADGKLDISIVRFINCYLNKFGDLK